MNILNDLEVEAPIDINDILIDSILNTSVGIISTKSVKVKSEFNTLWRKLKYICKSREKCIYKYFFIELSIFFPLYLSIILRYVKEL
jgi:hypothetical protein